MDELSKLTPTAWVLIAVAAAAGFGLSWAWRWYRHYRARKALRAAVIGGASAHLMDMLVPDGMGGGYHVDYLLLTVRGVMVIDLRDVAGNIFGGDQMAEWTVMDGAQRSTFTNPQSALYDRIAAVKAVAGDVPVEGRIVFTRRGKFPKGLPKWTVMLDALRGEFASSSDFTAPADGSAQYQEGWRRLQEQLKPSYMVDMR